MKNKLIIFYVTLTLSLLLCLIIVPWYILGTNFPTNTTPFDWKYSSIIVRLGCKKVAFPSDEQRYLFINNLYEQIQNRAGMLVKIIDLDSERISSGNFRSCQVVFVGDSEGLGKISYTTKMGRIKIIKVQNFPL